MQKHQGLRQLDCHGQPPDGIAPQLRAPLERVLQRAAVELLQQQERRRRRLSVLDVEAGAEGAGHVGMATPMRDLPVNGDLGEEVVDGAVATGGGADWLGCLEDGAQASIDAGADDAEATVGEGLDGRELRQRNVLMETLHHTLCRINIMDDGAWLS